MQKMHKNALHTAGRYAIIYIRQDN
jgi:hypothetical protein